MLKSLRFKPQSFFTERYSINAGEASIVLLNGASRTKKIFFHRSVTRTEPWADFFLTDESADRKNGKPMQTVHKPETFSARLGALRRFLQEQRRTVKKKHAAVDVLFEKEGSCGRTAPSNKKTNTMFHRKDTVFRYFWLRPKNWCFFLNHRISLAKASRFFSGIILFSEHELLLLLANKT